MIVTLLMVGGFRETVEIPQGQYNVLQLAWRQGDRQYVLRANIRGYPMDIEVPVGNIVAIMYERETED